MHAVVDVMRRADFSYDTTVHSHYIFPTDDSEDDFVNDCDPAWTFKQTARNILNEASPNHLYLDVVRVGTASRWTQYGEQLQLQDWSDRSINEKDVAFLTRDFLDAALSGSAVNDVIVFATNGLERSERPKGVMSLMTDAPTTAAPSTTTTVTSTTTVTLPTTVTSKTPSMTFTTTTVPSTILSAAAAASTATPPGPAVATKRKSSRRGALVEEDGLSFEEEGARQRQRRNITGAGQKRRQPKEEVDENFVALGLRLPFSKTTFYIIVVCTTIGVVLLVWGTCALVFYCCYRDDDAIKKHAKKEAEDEEEPMLISALGENAFDDARPSTMMISDHLRKVKEDRYNEEQMKSMDARGTISIG
ncbi:hypothetical protein PFISCL1PPCAC_3087 [Pristionchus fissidentatus]|uniref:Uncharacterized protein n=2 Tax=Pristionchus fissidentatus TaxID=1538716 RepID=A0AAV5V1V1_9BILA|nr:hypothetical protein PFISCL1PPCAC_3087 [Pristionchus fissidentatus]